MLHQLARAHARAPPTKGRLFIWMRTRFPFVVVDAFRLSYTGVVLRKLDKTCCAAPIARALRAGGGKRDQTQLPPPRCCAAAPPPRRCRRVRQPSARAEAMRRLALTGVVVRLGQRLTRLLLLVLAAWRRVLLTFTTPTGAAAPQSATQALAALAAARASGDGAAIVALLASPQLASDAALLREALRALEELRTRGARGRRAAPARAQAQRLALLRASAAALRVHEANAAVLPPHPWAPARRSSRRARCATTPCGC
jgi:hypothetical protein